MFAEAQPPLPDIIIQVASEQWATQIPSSCSAMPTEATNDPEKSQNQGVFLSTKRGVNLFIRFFFFLHLCHNIPFKNYRHCPEKPSFVRLLWPKCKRGPSSRPITRLECQAVLYASFTPWEERLQQQTGKEWLGYVLVVLDWNHRFLTRGK